MSQAHIRSGICGFSTHVEATPADDGRTVQLTITSDCPAVLRFAAELAEVDAFQEITFRGDGPRILALAHRLNHTACPVPSGLIKAVEVAAGLALPATASIEVEK